MITRKVEEQWEEQEVWTTERLMNKKGSSLLLKLVQTVQRGVTCYESIEFTSSEWCGLVGELIFVSRKCVGLLLGL